MQADLKFENHGSIYLLTPLTKAGAKWVDRYLPADAMHFGQAIVVEHRYVHDIAEGAGADGLGVSMV